MTTNSTGQRAGSTVHPWNEMGPIEAELVHRVLQRAVTVGYLLAGAAEFTYIRAAARGPDRHTIHRVPAWEDAVVHELLRRGWFTRGDPRPVTHANTTAAAIAIAVKVPYATRNRLIGWPPRHP